MKTVFLLIILCSYTECEIQQPVKMSAVDCKEVIQACVYNNTHCLCLPSPITF